jgi:hypothetical protein
VPFRNRTPKPKEGGINAASRDLGIERKEAQRAVKIAGLSDEAKQAARDVGLNAITSRRCSGWLHSPTHRLSLMLSGASVRRWKTVTQTAQQL